jgi:hypothetical protein
MDRLLRFPAVALANLIISVTGHAQALSNEELVTSMVGSACKKEFAQSYPERLLVITNGGGLNALIASAVAEAIRSRFAETMLASAPDSSSANLLIHIQEFNLSYKKGASRGFMKARQIKREFHCRLRIRIEKGVNGPVLESKDLVIKCDDIINPGEVENVNSGYIPQLAPKPPGSNWPKYAGTAAVTASVAILAYLFFSHR